jgi:hypothetical protein
MKVDTHLIGCQVHVAALEVLRLVILTERGQVSLRCRNNKISKLKSRKIQLIKIQKKKKMGGPSNVIGRSLRVHRVTGHYWAGRVRCISPATAN